MSERTAGWDLVNPPTDPGPQPELRAALDEVPGFEPHHDLTDASEARSTGDVAKEKAGDVKDSAVDAGRHVADVAKDQAQDVVGEAGRHAQDLLEQTRAELEQQAGTQQQRAAAGLHSIGSELRGLANGSQESGVVVDLAREGANRAESIARWLERREPGDVLEEVRSFARQRPGTFLALAAGAGVLSARLARGIQAGPPTADVSTPDPTDDPTSTPLYGAGPGSAPSANGIDAR